MFWTFPMKPVRVNDSLVDSLSLEDYTMEKKYDGHRAMLASGSGGCRIFTRQKVEMIVPKNLEGQLAGLKLPDGCLLDGEIWTPTKRGSWVHGRSVVCSLTIWDIVALEGRSIGPLPIEERRELLRRLIGAGTEDIRTVEWEAVSKDRIEQIRKEAVEHRDATATRSGFIHGVVIKRNGSPRRDHPKRSAEHVDWMKIVFFAQN